MTAMVLGWLVLSVTDSPFWVGAVAGMTGVGMLSLGALGGVLADRLERRKLVMAGHVVRGGVIFALAMLIFTDRVELWHIMVVGLLDGMIIAVKVPARLALTLDVVGRDLLLKATAANFAAMTIMGIVSPLVAGAVVELFHLAWAYVIIGGAEVASALALVRLQVERRERTHRQTPWADLKEGVGYVLRARTVRMLILLGLMIEVFGWSHEFMLPVMARDELKVGAAGLGYLIAAGGAGATFSTLLISSFGDFGNKGRLMIVGLIGYGLGLMLFAFSPWFPVSLALIALTYAMGMLYETTASTLLQTIVPDEMRGRVLSFQALSWGLSGLSGFHTGAIASRLGAPVAIAIGAAVLVLNAARVSRSVTRIEEEPAAGE